MSIRISNTQVKRELNKLVLACLNFATPYIKGYGYKLAATWMDNDLSGQKATEALAAFCKTEIALTHKPMNNVYNGFKDFNAFHMHNLN